jgi:uncharacterized FAD-dependent dehydrogenase
MIKELTITINPEDESNNSLIQKKIFSELKSQKVILKNQNEKGFEFVLQKKSVDARHGQIKIHLRYKVYIGESPKDSVFKLPEWKNVDEKSCKSVIIVGSGPAGLFGALKLLEYGIKPIIVERGLETSQRRKDIALISTKDFVNEDSNYCFGEGGAGTFSDGKLYTRSNKRGNIQNILEIFAHFGADKKITTDAHPHIGTEKLPGVINNMRNKIIELGGEFYFNSRVCDFLMQENNGKKVVCGVVYKNLLTNEENPLNANAVVFATGHSANDIYFLIAKYSPLALEAKTFAAGVRVEHPRSLIDAIQYHGQVKKELGAAEYRVTTQVEDRGVYSFCMCPGGFVVPSSSNNDEIVVNGMSASARNSKWSNAAIVVEIRPEDIPQEFVVQAEKLGSKDLAGLLYRNKIEKDAKLNGNGQAAPAQRVTDFIENKKSQTLPISSFTPGIVSSNLNEWLPTHISKRLAKGFVQINKNMKGFVCQDALMIAPETRTSTPVRILRNKETFECEYLKGLFPVGEGSGYSGGIVSSAMDGENACQKIAEMLKGSFQENLQENKSKPAPEKF